MKNKIIILYICLCSCVFCFGNEELKKQINRLIELQPELQTRLKENHPEMVIPDAKSRVLVYLENLLEDPEETLRNGDKDINRAFKPSIGVYLFPDEYSWERSDLHAAPFILWSLPGKDYDAFPKAAYRYRIEWLNFLWKDKEQHIDEFLASSLYKCVQDLSSMVSLSIAPPRVPEILKEMYSDVNFLRTIDNVLKKADNPINVEKVILEFGRATFARFPSSFNNLVPYLEMTERKYAKALQRSQARSEERRVGKE